MVIGLILVLLIAAGGAGAFVVNASLSSTYSPGKAVVDYLTAQKKGNYQFMFANANFLRGDGSFNQFFDGGALGALLAMPQNTDISDVKVASTTVVDSNTQTVNTTMTWAGHHITRAFTLHRDLNRVHYSLYNSWRIDIPFQTLHVTVPNQPGDVTVDDMLLPQSAIKSIEVIQGFHKITMGGTDLYDKTSKDADAIDGDVTVAFTNTISASGLALVRSTFKKEFLICNTKKYQTCLNHLYHSAGQAGYVYYWSLAGYPNIYFTTYTFTLTSDPTAGMKLVIAADGPKVSVSGTCRYTLTVDGGKKYYFKGPWKGVLDVTGGIMSYYDLDIRKCLDSKG